MTRRVPCVPVVVDPVIRAAHGFLYRDTGRCVHRWYLLGTCTQVGITMTELPRVSHSSVHTVLCM